MDNFPEIKRLLTHDEPMIVIDKLIAVEARTAHSQVLICEQNIFFDYQTGSVGAHIGIEYMAQTIALWSGYHYFLEGKPPAIALLLGCRHYNSTIFQFKKGELLDIYSEQVFVSERMSVFSCVISSKGKQLIDGKLNVFMPHKTHLEKMLTGEGAQQ
ncbi:MAG: 3-hydroxydecanoyl-ACP dehydratase [Psychromonas sp.]|nr:3-hydroxydecanoyl-ACP dehydratase [Psychromonas sp.]